MKAVLISTHPKWCELIASGKKTIEVRKTRPKIDTPFKCYIYCTKGSFDITYCLDLSKYSVKKVSEGRGKVIGEFVCNGIMRPNNNLSRMAKESLLTENELFEYSNGKPLYGWRISDLKIYEKPKSLGEFKKACLKGDCNSCIYEECKLTRPPQSWCYVEELK